jgi:CHAT domain-containing protein/Flp pilus assembly protein TadD
VFFSLRKLQEAEKYYLDSKAIREKVLGKEHPDYANSLSRLASLYRGLGDYEKALSHMLEFKAIREKNLGKEHPDYASSLNNLAILYREMGDYEKAEPLALEALAIRQKVLGKEHPDYLGSLNNLANSYNAMGNYEMAEPLYREALSLKEKVLGKDHPDYAQTLYNLAVLYVTMGKYEVAETLFLQAKDVFEKELGKEHVLYANSLEGLAVVYDHMGNYNKAEPIYLEAKTIREELLGKEHPDYAQSLHNLADLYVNLNNYGKAEPLYLEALVILEKTLGKEHPDYASLLNNLANLYQGLGDYIKSERFHLEATAIREKVLGKEHPDYAQSLYNLAESYINLNNYKKAELLYLEAKAIREKVLGKEHEAYSDCLNALALLYEKQGNFSGAESLLKEAATLEQARIAGAASYLSERELALYASRFQTDGAKLGVNLLTWPATSTSTLSALAFDHALFYKGFLLTAASRLNTPTSTSPASMEINNRLKGYRRRLAAEYARPIAERQAVADLEEKANVAEKELARSLVGYADAIRQVKFHEVKVRLKKSEAAIEFIHFQVNFPKKTGRTIYAALVVLPELEQPKFILLFEEKSLDSLLNTKSERKSEYVSSLYSLADRGAIAMESSKKSLYETVWKSLDKELDGIKTIYFSPSGLLHRINMDAIPISESETLADRYNLIELNSTRHLVIPAQVNNVNNDAVLYGGIQFDQDSMLLNNEPLFASRSRGELDFISIDSALRGGSWSYLAGTEREVEAIGKIVQSSGIQVDLKKGYQATEESFKNVGANNIPSPRILHLATHGYFFSDVNNKNDTVSNTEPVFKISDHPMLRSGLILAGGNATWQGKQTLEGREDGILTAYEISQMNLSNTELVVLSACETGLGDIQGNEGVYGLQRAFKIAGAKYLIMSLWQVPDKQTSMLMTTFYKKWLQEKLTIPDAFHAAQKEMRELGFDPYQWAGFVLVE